MSMKEKIVDFLVLMGILIFILSYFTPEYLLSDIIPTGGDTPSHYYPFHYMKSYLIPNYKVIGWSNAWYLGFPIFQFYFPLPYFLMVILSYVIKAPVAFKIIDIIGVFTLPIAIYLAMKWMDFKFPMPIIGAIFMLQMLFMETINTENYSMYGGNIKSTLAGEFAHQLSLSFSILFFGLLYRGIKTKKYHIQNSILLALTIITHLFPAMLVTISSAFFLFCKKKKDLVRNFTYLFIVFGLGFMLAGFWALPFMSKIEFTTSYDWRQIRDLGMLLPKELWIFFILAVFGIYKSIKNKDSRIYYMLFSIVTSAIIFALIPDGHLWNVRFLPPIYLFVLVIAAYGLSELIEKFKATWLVPLIILLLVVIPLNDFERTKGDIPNWIRWNFEGFEPKSSYSIFYNTMNYLKSLPFGRVFHEYSDSHNVFGTPRAFECIPYYAEKPVMEGLLIDSAVSAPFEFILQPELSTKPSCPISYVPCPSVNIERGLKHLRMFNVDYFVATSDRVKNLLRANENFQFLKGFGNIEIYKIKNEGRYVTVPKYEPVLIDTKNWKLLSLEWFQRLDLLDTPLVFSKFAKDESKFKFRRDSLDNLPMSPIDNNCTISEKVDIEGIEFTTSCVGKPHIISISYFPNWKVIGADSIEMVSPSLMLVYPKQENVIIYYGHTLSDWIGTLLSVIGVIIVIIYLIPDGRKYLEDKISVITSPKKTKKKSEYKEIYKSSNELFKSIKEFYSKSTGEIFKSLRLDYINKKLSTRFLIFFSIFLIFTLTTSFDRQGTNPGSRFMLTKAVAKYGQLSINEDDMKFYSGMDYAVYNEKIYSDKPPGLSFLAVPFYLLGDFIYKLGIPFPKSGAYNYVGDGYAYFLITIFLCIISAYGSLKLYDISNLLGFKSRTSLLLSYIFSFGTIYWVYASSMFSHSTTAAFLIVSVYYIIKSFLNSSYKNLFISGIFLGISVTIEHSVLFLLPVFYIYAILKTYHTSKFLSIIKKLVIFSIPIVVFASLLGLYNYLAFGNPLTSSYQFSTFKATQNFNQPIGQGLYMLLFSTWRGIFFYSPILLLMFIGSLQMYKKYSTETLFFITLIAIIPLFFSAYSYGSGGLAYGPRHLIHVIGFMVLLIGPCFEREYYKKVTDLFAFKSAGNIAYIIIVIVLIAISLFHSFLGAYVSSLPYPETNKNPVYEITLKQFESGARNSFLLSNMPTLFGILTIVDLLLIFYLLNLNLLQKLTLKENKPNIMNSLFIIYFILFVAFYMFYFRDVSSTSGLTTPFIGIFKTSFEFDEWKYTTSDIPNYFQMNIDDSGWSTINLPFNSKDKSIKEDYFRGSFYLQNTSFRIKISADDCISELYVNGNKMIEEKDCRQCENCNPDLLDISKYTKLGQNVIAVKVVNTIGEGSFMVDNLDILWKYSSMMEQNWHQIQFDDSKWKPIRLPYHQSMVPFRFGYFRNWITIPEKFNKIMMNIKADDCIQEVYVNEKKIYTGANCGPGIDQNGKMLDLTQYVKSGKNLIAIKIADFGQEIRLEII